MIGVHFEMFLDRQKFFKRLDRKKRRVLQRTGAFARTTMKRRMRKRKRASREGEAPSAHENPLIRKLTFYGYDRQADSVVVAPKPLAPPRGTKLRGKKSIVELLNDGGEKIRTDRRGRRIESEIKPRPITEPVLPPATEKLEQLLQTVPL